MLSCFMQCGRWVLPTTWDTHLWTCLHLWHVFFLSKAEQNCFFEHWVSWIMPLFLCNILAFIQNVASSSLFPSFNQVNSGLFCPCKHLNFNLFSGYDAHCFSRSMLAGQQQFPLQGGFGSLFHPTQWGTRNWAAATSWLYSYIIKWQKEQAL